MALREKVLRKKAAKLELKGLQKNKLTPDRISSLEELLHDVYAINRPKPSDYCNRRDLVRVFNEIAKEIYGNSNDVPVVEEFGSFTMDIFSAKSDLDLSVNFSNNAVEFPRQKKIQTLRKFAKKFYAIQMKGHVSGVHPIMTAKVPILKIVDRGTGIECDISVENRDGILKSKVVHMISSIDERFQKLSFLMKAWAKAHDINSSKDHTLNSLSILLLVAFHLQTRDPPILPSFSAIFKDGTDSATVEKLLHTFLNYGKRNKESLAELFVTLLVKLSSVEKLWPKGLCASTYEGSWISKTWDFKVGCISVEDFTDRSQNVARAVGTEGVKKIYKCIQLSTHYVFAFLDGQIQGPKLREILFGQDAIPSLVGTGTTNFEKSATQPCIPLESIQTKRMQPREGWGGKDQGVPLLTKRTRSMGGWGGKPIGSWGGTQQTWGGTPTEGCGGTQQAWGGTPKEGWGGTQQAMPFDPILAKKIPSTEGCGGMPTGNGGGTQQAMHFNPIVAKKMRSTEGWGGMPTGNWGGMPTGNWGGTPTEGWGGTQPPIPLDHIQTRKMQSTGWGGTHHTVSLDPIRTKEMLSTGGWGVPQQAHGETSSNVNLLFTPPIPYRTLPFASSLGNQVSCAPLKFPSVQTKNPVALETSCGRPPQLPFVPLKNPSGFNGSHSNDQVVTMPDVGRMGAKHVRPSGNQISRQGHPFGTV